MVQSRRSASRIAAALVLGFAAVTVVVLASVGGTARPVSASARSVAPRHLPFSVDGAWGHVPKRPVVEPGTESRRWVAPGWLKAIGQAAVYVIAGFVLVLLLLPLRALYRMVRAVELPHTEPVDRDSERDKTERLAEAVETGLAAVESGAPTDGVIACWVALEDAAASAGMPRAPSETSAEFTIRVLGAGGDISGSELLRLAQLYREARYSTHDTTEEVRTEARAALARLREQLSARASAP